MPKREAIAAGLILLFSTFTLASPDRANDLFIGAKDWIVANLDQFFTLTASGALLLVLALPLIPRFNVRLGADDERPEFSKLSWFAMLLSAGLASGVLYWATAEPLTHFQNSPHLSRAGLAPLSDAAARNAVTLTIFHWGLHGWGFYALTGLSVSFFAYRKQRPLALSAMIVAPARAPRLAVAIDLLGVLATVFGVATSMGIAVGGMNAAVSELSSLSISPGAQLMILAVVTVLAVVSVLLGLRRGIARLSQLNLLLSLLLLLAVLLLGPTGFILGFLASTAGDYLVQAIPMGFWTGSSAADVAWQGGWTVFYWGWWLAWAPFVGLFIARISRGRTLREFVIGVLAVPTVAVICWMAIFGGAALEGELRGGESILAAVNDDYALGTVAMIKRFGTLTVPLVVLITVLLFSWLITSLDSAALVLSTTLRDREADRSNAQKAAWGIALGLVTAALLTAGGLDALQAASIVAGLPVGVLLIICGPILVRALLQDTASVSAQPRSIP